MQAYKEIMKSTGIDFVYLFRHFPPTTVRNLACTSAPPVLLHLPVFKQVLNSVLCVLYLFFLCLYAKDEAKRIQLTQLLHILKI